MVSGRFKHLTFKLISCCAALFLTGLDGNRTEARRLGTPAADNEESAKVPKLRRRVTREGGGLAMLLLQNW